MTDEDRATLRQACALVLAGMLVLLVDLRIQGIDLVNDVVGAVLLAAGALRLAAVAGPANELPLSLGVLVVPAVAADVVLHPAAPAALLVRSTVLLFWVAVAQAMAGLAWPDDVPSQRLGRRWSTQLLLVAVVGGVDLVVTTLVWATGGDRGAELLLAVPLTVAGIAVWVHRVVAVVGTLRWARRVAGALAAGAGAG